MRNLPERAFLHKLVIGFSILNILNTSAYSWQKNCDIVGKNLGNVKAKSQEECLTECNSRDECQAGVYITGWKKCFLKSQAERSVELTMKSGLKKGSIKNNSDFSGKDIKSVIKKTAEACQKSCEQEELCQAFTYIAGYDTCWHKKAEGRFYEKIFYCYKK